MSYPSPAGWSNEEFYVRNLTIQAFRFHCICVLSEKQLFSTGTNNYHPLDQNTECLRRIENVQNMRAEIYEIADKYPWNIKW